MTFVLLTVILSALIVFLLYYFLKSKKIIHSLTQKLSLSKAEQTAAYAKERRLNTELTTLKTKFDQTFTDPVTNLLGLHLFEDRLNQSIKESERYQGIIGVLLIDIDDFRMINDALSYEVGDAILKSIAERLQTCIRKVDTVSRFAKDTFVVLLTQLSKPEVAALVAQRILQSFAEPFLVGEHELYVTACIGIAIYPADGTDAAALTRSADQALHLAKEKGTSVYQFYQEKMHVRSQRELVLHNSMSKETIFHELILYYQPIMNVKNESIFCMDALLHWQHPQLGLVYPAEVFVHAEKQRKLNLITEWIIRSACKQFLHWRSLGVVTDYIGIPLLASQLENIHFVYQIAQILQELKFNPEWILLEISGGAHLLPHPVIAKAFNMLNYVGVRVALDHFGAESFSLKSLKDITVHYLKLDRALIHDIDTNSQALALMESLLFLAKSMSMQVIIQGIESDEQIRILKELGCILMQGHLIGAPLSEREVSDKMVAT